MSNNSRSLLLALYSHPEHYPPTLNAISELSTVYDKIYILYRPFSINRWKYPKNVTLIPSGRTIDVRKQERSLLPIKLFYFFQFTFKLLLLIRKQKPHAVLLYDSFPVLSFNIIKKIIGKPTLLWYHNHDVPEITKLRKYSIGWFAARYEHSIFHFLDIFSLPSEKRKEYYPMTELHGKYFFIPNYPSINKFEGHFAKTKKNPIRILYQGTIGLGHGIECVSKLISITDNLELHLAGSDISNFVKHLQELIKKDKLIYHGNLPYVDLFQLTSSCHIGIAILEPKSVAYTTASTASNKIYEYAACGLPILYYDHEHFNYYLSKYEWAFATDLTEKSLMNCLNSIMENYDFLSSKARNDFENELNFERVFAPVKEFLKDNLSNDIIV